MNEGQPLSLCRTRVHVGKVFALPQNQQVKIAFPGESRYLDCRMTPEDNRINATLVRDLG